MSSRELVVLGTASQVPTRHRNHNGYFLRWDDVGVMVDPGEGTQRQMTLHGVRTSRIHHICITHFHGDHCLGLAGIIQRISLDAVPHDVQVHYPASGQVYFERLRHASIFVDRSRIVPRPIEESGIVADDGKLRIRTAKLEHTVPCWGYRVEEPDGRKMLPQRLAELGVKGRAVRDLIRQGELELDDGRVVRVDQVSEPRPGQAFAFVMDTRRCDAAVDLARGADMLVAESTYLSDYQREARERGHMTATDAARVAKDAGARQLVLTHFSQRHPRTEDFVAEAIRIHPDVLAVRDGDRVSVPPRRK